MNVRVSLLLLLGCCSVAAARLTAPGDPAVAGFTLKDTAGKAVSLDEFKDQKAVVLVFTGTECPVNNAYMPRLAELHREYAPKGVQFLALNANVQDTPERMAKHAKEYAIPFPVLKDVGNQVADAVGAQRTPEAAVLDAGRVVRYRGRIDDQYGVGFARPKPTRRDLALALDAVLAGKPVAQPAVPVSGCYIARVAKPKAEGAVTFAKQVSRILQNNCQECHRPGQVGPMPLQTYDEAVAWSQTIREVLDDGRMPPWYADPSHGKFANDRRLAPADRAALLAWLDGGMARGDDRDLPPPRSFPEGWTIGTPDAVFEMPTAYDVPADMPRGGIPYQRFKVATNFTEDRWVERAEARAGALSVVHHIIVYLVPPGETFFQGNPRTPVLVGTAPGDMPLVLRPGMAKKVPAGSSLVFEMHYTPNGTAAKDRSRVGFVFAKEPPKYLVRTMPVGNPGFKIPAGADNHPVEQWATFSSDRLLLGFMPHMHLRGKDFKYEVTYPDGRTETLLWVPRYNFNWQSVYRLAEPIPLPKGTKLHCLAHFDNSARNPNNPDPTKDVRWGDQTWEEMMIGWIDVATPK